MWAPLIVGIAVFAALIFWVVTASGGLTTGGPFPPPPNTPSIFVGSTPYPTPAADRVKRALRELSKLRGSAGTFVDGYDRDLFGDGWHDLGDTGCDARNRTLARDLTELEFRDDSNECVVVSGVLHDPYSGKVVDFERGEVSSQDVQIDHVVPLAWAWRNGADNWPAAKRERFYNDQLELLAVDGPTNNAKSDFGPAKWLPPNTAYRCTYVIRFVSVLNRYSLAIDAPDRSAARSVLRTCA